MSDTRPRRGRDGTGRPGAARRDIHPRRSGRLTAATAQRVLDGGDGPSPLPQFLAAASAPATAAELRGESAARAAFRSSQHTAPLPRDIPRRSRVRTTSAVVITKAIAAIALTASTAGGIALATTATPADPQARTTTGASPTADAAGSSLLVTTAGPEVETRRDEAAEVAPTEAPGLRGEATPKAKDALPAGRCRATSSTPAADKPDKAGAVGKAAESPACTDTDLGPDAATRPQGRPDAPPGNPDRRTGKPDTTGRPKSEAAKEGGSDRAGKPDKPDKPTDDRPGAGQDEKAARAGNADQAENGDRGASDENRRKD